MKLKAVEKLSIEIFKKFMKHFAPRRFNYTYAVNVLKFRERKDKNKKRANIICIKKGHTKAKYLSPKITKDGIIWNVPNYTRAKEWKVPLRKFPSIYAPILNEKNFWKVVSFLKKTVGIDAIKMAKWFFAERKKPRPIFKAKKSVYEELSKFLDSEIQSCANKLRNITIKEN